MAKQPTMADHYEPIDLASPNASSGADYSSSVPADDGAGEVAGEPAIDIASDGVEESTAPEPQAQRRQQPAPAAGLVSSDEPEATDFPADPLEEAAAAEAKSAASPPAEEFTPELLARAKGYGFDEATAKQAGTSENLQWMMAQRDQIAAEWGQKQIAAHAQQQSPQQQLPTAPQAPVAPAPTQQQVAQQAIFQKLAIDRPKLLGEGFDKDSIDFFEGMANHFNGELEKAGQYIGALAQQQVAHQQQAAQQITGRSQADEQERLAQGVDEFISKLGPDWEAEFGKGDGWSQPQGSPGWNARAKLYQTVRGLQVADAQSNQQAPVPELLQRAHTALHYKKQQELARKAISDKVQKRQSQTIARGGSQRGAPMTGIEKALRRNAAFDRKHQLEGAVG